ncbi:hypothetical protein BIFGAL_03557 [Bifidobacterium gallicum DSM 20093 = LMG 11596]|uniref:Uncharacterized protein n=1 Tax=Bifidobacterium gallicum DSM 20093 = LMG 11596 TaxID=561180 RepID=D1NUN1_9BIFI|nr:hypothetical protein BIFGAL_03557 [Bifidobacterium gallicum DSM 20093 = LMG 11596]
MYHRGTTTSHRGVELYVFVPPWYNHATDFAQFCSRLYHRGTDACIFIRNPYRACTTVVQTRVIW